MKLSIHPIYRYPLHCSKKQILKIFYLIQVSIIYYFIHQFHAFI